MKRTDNIVIDYYDRKVIQQIIDKYAMDPIDATRMFMMSQTHEMLENADYAMWEFGELALFEIWEAEKATGDPRSSMYMRQ